MQAQEELAELFAAMCRELRQWRTDHPQATFGEIAEQVTPRRQELTGRLLVALAVQEGNGYVVS